MWNAGIAKTGTAARCHVRIMIDGVQAGVSSSPATTYNYMGGSYNWEGGSAIAIDSMAGNAVVAVSAGSHTIGLQWKNMSDLTPTPDHGESFIYPNHAAGYGASMIVMEIGR